jgi:hypothetical protein
MKRQFLYGAASFLYIMARSVAACRGAAMPHVNRGAAFYESYRIVNQIIIRKFARSNIMHPYIILRLKLIHDYDTHY